jgi:nitroreductase
MTNEQPEAQWEALERIMTRQRAIREFTDAPVDDAILEQVIGVARFAPSGGNRQPSRFIVIRDRDTKAKLGAIFDELGQEIFGGDAPVHTPWGDVPVLIACCAEEARDSRGASIFPLVQNLLLALHARGLGSVLTTRWKQREAEVKPLLGLPDSVEAHAILPVGWPARTYGRGKRLPVKELLYREKFGQAW